MAAWIAVDGTDAANGGTKVVPGSHGLEIFCPQPADTTVSFTRDDVPVPDGLASVHADMQAGRAARRG